MLEMKCDNDDGTINWKRRASILVLTQMLCGGSKRRLLSQINDNKRLARLVTAEWDRVQKAKRKVRSNSGNNTKSVS